MSRLLSACAAPLMMFIIGTGITGWRLPPIRCARCRYSGSLGIVGGRVRVGQRDPEDRIGAELALVVGAIQLDHLRIQLRLVARVEADQGHLEHGVDVLDRPERALATIALGVAIAQLHRLARPGGCARWHGCAAVDAGGQDDVRLDGRVAARIDDLACADIAQIRLMSCGVLQEVILRMAPSLPRGRARPAP